MKPNQIPLQINRNRKNAFTLVELMVAMALIILMLSIMSQAFVIATGTMQGLKEVADMQEKIRPAINLLQRDLGANHFEGSKKLSDPEFWDNGPPKEGYFMLWQDKAYDVAEGATNNVTFGQSAAAANHMLAFTAKLPGKSPNDFFEENLALPINAPIKLAFGNTFFNGPGTPKGMIDSNIRRFETTSGRVHSDWAEVAYFLGPHNVGVATPVADGNTDGKNNPPSLPYFNLYRQQKLVLPSYNIEGAALPLLDQNLGIISANPIDNNVNLDANLNPKIGVLLANDYFSGLSFHLDSNSKIDFNKPSDLTVPWKRMGNRTFTGLTANHYLGKPPVNTPLFSEYTSST
ncbi:MAG: type II secretion system protein, partial [Planctomycetota bacterium]